MPKRRVEARVKIEAEIKASAREALRRYCECMDLSMAAFIASRAKEFERMLVSRLNEAQRASYFDGTLLWDEMSDNEKDAFRAPSPAVDR
jgi:hypothetical protein